MADHLGIQPVVWYDGTDQRGLAADKAVYFYLTDGTNTAAINASGHVSVNVENSITVTATSLDIRALDNATDDILVYGYDGSTNRAIKTNASGQLEVAIVSGGSAGNEYQDGDSETGAYGRVILGGDGTNLQIVSVDTNGRINVNIVDPLPAGTNSIGDIGTVTTVTGITNVVHVDDNSGSITVDDGGTSLTVDGTVAATQSGTWDINSVTTVGTITNVVHVDDNSGSITVDDGGASLTIDATALDIRALSHTTDSIAIGDGTDLLAIDASGRASTSLDNVGVTAVPVSKDGSANSVTNPLYVYNVGDEGSEGEVYDRQTTASVAKGSSATHTYVVSSGKTLLIDQVIVAASGQTRFDVKVGPSGSEVTVLTGFTSAAKPTEAIKLSGLIKAAATNNVQVVIRNDAFSPTGQDLYSTVIGREV